MRHDWIYDVLNDLQTYAENNGLTQIAGETTKLLATARAELTEVTRIEQADLHNQGADQMLTPANTDAKLVK
jgi:hypothetical protein